MATQCDGFCPGEQSDDDASSLDPWSDLIQITANGETEAAGEGADAQGGGKARAISKGNPFAGRMQGGGERSGIFGTWEYGSGYPHESGRGVAGRGFPFYFWPVVWAGEPVGADDAYLYASSEYGQPSNTSRPGGPLSTTAFGSNITGNIYRVLTDSTTATLLLPQLVATCISFLNLSSLMPVAYPLPFRLPLPEQAVQYFRASSIALTLDGYNNTAALASQGVLTPVPLPGYSGSDPALACLNATIGRAALLVADIMNYF